MQSLHQVVLFVMKPQATQSRRSVSGQTIFLASVVALSLLVIGVVVFLGERGGDQAAVSRLRLEEIPFHGARAYDYLKQICALGPRPSGSAGMTAQQKLLATHFQQLGAQIEWQRFTGRDPRDGAALPLANLIVHWHPESKDRILLCTHYDTLPFPMLDRQNPRGTFIGANDGASGVALLMELGHEIPTGRWRYGIDFIFFDGEEYIFSEDHPFFLGSEYFAEQYARNRPPYRYRWGVLLDMIGDIDLQIYQERYSTSWRDTRPLVDQIWGIAARLGVREFISKRGYYVRDDHLALRNTARIPTCDIIDFDYPPWHTQADTPENCSALSLAKVGWVIREWMKVAK